MAHAQHTNLVCALVKKLALSSLASMALRGVVVAASATIVSLHLGVLPATSVLRLSQISGLVASIPAR